MSELEKTDEVAQMHLQLFVNLITELTGALAGFGGATDDRERQSILDEASSLLARCEEQVQLVSTRLGDADDAAGLMDTLQRSLRQNTEMVSELAATHGLKASKPRSSRL